MRNMVKMILSLFGLIVFSTIAVADVNKGQKIFQKKLKAACGFNGAQFAMKHTKKEWEDIYTEGKFSDELIKICPKAQIEPKFIPDIYDFSYHYANDSGNIPSC